MCVTRSFCERSSRSVMALAVIVMMVLGLTGTAQASTGDIRRAPVGIAATMDGGGYWVTSSSGEVRAFGSAHDYGDLPALNVNVTNVVGIEATPSGGGYWLAASDGGVFSFGDARFWGSMGGKPLNKPVVGMAATSSGAGYWLVASDGGIFAFGDARFWGSMGGQALNSPIAGMSRTPDGRGYWLVASDGGIFAFGTAGFYRSLGGIRLAEPVTDMVPTPSGRGYWLTARDGGVFSFGDAGFHGRPTVQGVSVPTGRGKPSDLQLSASGAAFIAAFEGFRSTPYNDTNGYCTIGYGHLLHSSPCTSADAQTWGTWTEAEAKGWLQQDANRLINKVKPEIASTPLSQAEFDALTSWTFNLGPAAFPNTGLNRALSAVPPAYSAVPGELMKWVNDSRGKLCGLYRRRSNEGHLFSTGSYTVDLSAPCPPGYR